MKGNALVLGNELFEAGSVLFEGLLRQNKHSTLCLLLCQANSDRHGLRNASNSVVPVKHAEIQ